MIRIISTGGTMDSSPEYKAGEKSIFDGSNLRAMLAQARLTVAVELEALMQKDSRDLTEKDLERIMARCRACPEDRVVVTHGTDTMAETARFLGAHKVPNKTVVLVGSFIPYSKPASDAMFNLGFALADAQRLPVGVWLSMGGRSYIWHDVEKDHENQRFQEILQDRLSGLF